MRTRMSGGVRGRPGDLALYSIDDEPRLRCRRLKRKSESMPIKYYEKLNLDIQSYLAWVYGGAVGDG